MRATFKFLGLMVAGVVLGLVFHFRISLFFLAAGVLRSSSLLMIAHAGGALEGPPYSNSVAAIETSIQSGFQVIEVDFERTSDGHVVLLHDWETTYTMLTGIPPGVKTLAELLSSRRNGRTAPMTGDEFLSFLKDHSGFCVISDPKFSNEDFLRWLLERGAPLAHRFIPQVYSPSEITLATNLGFRNLIWTLYRSTLDDDSVVELAKQQKLLAITAPSFRLGDGSLVSRLSELGVPVYTHTVNSKIAALRFYGMGVQGVYTDTLTPAFVANSPNIAHLGCLQ